MCKGCWVTYAQTKYASHIYFSYSGFVLSFFLGYFFCKGAERTLWPLELQPFFQKDENRSYLFRGVCGLSFYLFGSKAYLKGGCSR
jgi:hypothetical protein